MARSEKDSNRRRRAPASSPEARENQLIALAVDAAEKQLIEGTASAQVITHYLKLGTTRERLEKEKIARETELLKTKVESMNSTTRVEELYANAISAMREYNGTSISEAEEDYED